MFTHRLKSHYPLNDPIKWKVKKKSRDGLKNLCAMYQQQDSFSTAAQVIRPNVAIKAWKKNAFRGQDYQIQNFVPDQNMHKVGVSYYSGPAELGAQGAQLRTHFLKE